MKINNYFSRIYLIMKKKLVFPKTEIYLKKIKIIFWKLSKNSLRKNAKNGTKICTKSKNQNILREYMVLCIKNWECM